MLYEKMLEAYVDLGDEAGAEETRAIIESLQKNVDGLGNTKEAGKQEETKKAERPEAPKEPGSSKEPDSKELELSKEVKEDKSAVGPGVSEEAIGPGVESRWTGVDGAGQALLDRCLEEALQATARQDFEAAIKAYQEMERIYLQYGDSETAVRTDVMIEGLERLMEEYQ